MQQLICHVQNNKQVASLLQVIINKNKKKEGFITGFWVLHIIQLHIKKLKNLIRHYQGKLHLFEENRQALQQAKQVAVTLATHDS